MRVICLMMQKNEKYLLDCWVSYYGYMFGYENLVVFDNGSNDIFVISQLRKYENIGIKVIWEYDTQFNFRAKGDLFTQYIKELDKSVDYDFALTCDCDEYLVDLSNRNISCRRDDILACLERLERNGDAYVINNSIWNVPERPGYYNVQRVPKGFFAKGTAHHLDHGLHNPRSISGQKQQTMLGHIHLHNKGFEHIREHAKYKLREFIDVSTINKDTDYRGQGNHLIKYFQMTEEDYVSQYDNKPMLYFRNFDYLLDAMGIETIKIFGNKFETAYRHEENEYCLFKVPTHILETSNAQELRSWSAYIRFDPTDYLCRASDLANLHPSLALWHFTEYGFREGRFFGPGDNTQLAMACRRLTEQQNNTKFDKYNADQAAGLESVRHHDVF